ncbi:MAG TPA: bifunctional tetrahydrofolate synthase/dihydrofolate synthase [Burkholderiales bacterium]|nr:bifunctional tetrahydrofolate synthase/dihydrofolate synthase [Burkholderiales bacterium]
MSLSEWLVYLESLHGKTIDMGLERVAIVAAQLFTAMPMAIVTVGGTNGKGSTCAYLEAILIEAGYRVGLYTSPHLLRYNERIRINRTPVSDEALVSAFDRIEAVRGKTSLTYFEFGTLAAMHLFEQAAVDVAILEVGLGGRLDAVNVFDTDCAIVTCIDIDHTEFLGTTREQIGREKAGIFRSGRPAICADASPPRSLRSHAQAIGADWRAVGEAYRYEVHATGWDYTGEQRYANLPLPAMRGSYQVNNAAAAIAALELLQQRLPVPEQALRLGLKNAVIPGRFQVLPGLPLRILDVAHNPHGAAALAENLGRMPVTGKTYAVFAMLADKDIASVVAAMTDEIDIWLAAGLNESRGASAAQMHTILEASGATRIQLLDSVEQAWNLACEQASENDRICVFGSFYTVAAVLRLIAD